MTPSGGGRLVRGLPQRAAICSYRTLAPLERRRWSRRHSGQQIDKRPTCLPALGDGSVGYGDWLVRLVSSR